MLLYLPKSEYLPALDALADDRPFQEFVEALGEVLKAGLHWVKAAPLLLKRLAGWPGLSDGQRHALQEAGRMNVMPTVPIAEVTDWLVLTGPGGAQETPPVGATWHRRPWDAVRSAIELQRTVLGAEMVADARWFRWWALGFAAARVPGQRSTRTVQLDPHGLGGSTADREAPAHLAAGRPVVCVADSDKDHATATEGGTARKLRRALERRPADSLPAHLEVLDARTAENLVPAAMVDRIGTGRAWVGPMTRRGFFVGPGAPPDAALRWLNVGRNACAGRLLHGVADDDTRACRIAAIDAIRRSDADADQASPCLQPDGTRDCTALADREAAKAAGAGRPEWGAPQAGCVLVRSVGKLPGDLDDSMDAMAKADGADAAALWLVDQWPAEGAGGEPLWDPARRLWSWGLAMPRRIRSR